MKDLKEQLVRLGAQRPDLRKHLRPILRHMEAAMSLRDKVDLRRYPLLRQYVDKGLIYLDAQSNEIIMQADDGTEVGWGDADLTNYRQLEKYLKHNPHPAEW